MEKWNLKIGDYKMYSEKSYKNYIFWVQVKRIVLIIILSSLGAALGVLIGKILESTLKMTSFNNLIIIISTIIFFLLSLLLTVGTGKEVQDGYWKIAVLRKLTVIQKNLELNNQLLKSVEHPVKSKLSPLTKDLDSNKKQDKGEGVNASELYKFEETALVPQGKIKKKKVSKTIKKPEELK